MPNSKAPSNANAAASTNASASATATATAPATTHGHGARKPNAFAEAFQQLTLKAKDAIKEMEDKAKKAKQEREQKKRRATLTVRAWFACLRPFICLFVELACCCLMIVHCRRTCWHACFD